MDRRTFVTGAFGFVALTACALTAQGGGVDDVVGPALRDGIDLRDEPDGTRVAGCYGDQKLFVVDHTGADLVALADGTRTIEQIAQEVGGVAPADAASFFVTLGKAGYLRNEVYVNLREVQA